MSELEDIKARLAKFNEEASNEPQSAVFWEPDMKIYLLSDDLARAIAIAEGAMRRNNVEMFENDPEQSEQLRKARAAVLALRDARCIHQEFVEGCPCCKALADTESYEQYR